MLLLDKHQRDAAGSSTEPDTSRLPTTGVQLGT